MLPWAPEVGIGTTKLGRRLYVDAVAYITHAHHRHTLFVHNIHIQVYKTIYLSTDKKDNVQGKVANKYHYEPLEAH